jgi:hypothetical protein
VSDDTVLHLAVAENLCENKNLSPGMRKNYLFNKRKVDSCRLMPIIK